MYRGQLYVLRVWKEPGLDEPEGWRASLLNTVTQEKRYFASPQTLLRYLLETEGASLQAVSGLDLPYQEVASVLERDLENLESLDSPDTSSSPAK
ncbi:MAG: hypothetical protein C4331_17405 [Meiothermus sp.]